MSITAIIKTVTTVLGFLREWLSFRKSQDDRAAGRAEANESTLRQNAERVGQANEAEAQGRAEHNAKSDDSAFDQDFRRRD